MPAALPLPLAALLEAGGDAVIRRGLHGRRVALLAVGAAVLFAYGVVVDTAPWELGRLLGVYVAVFFVMAQLLDAVMFGAKPSASILAGGAPIVAAGPL